MRAGPAVAQGFVFERVERGFIVGDKSGFERAKPVFTPPAERGGAQGEAGQFGERVVRDGFAAVEEEGNLVAAKSAFERAMIGVETADDDGAMNVMVCLCDACHKPCATTCNSIS